MQRPSVPDKKESKDYCYVFKPVPMDPPPMDSDSFIYYFKDPDDADGEAKWITRFLMLQSSSFFYSDVKLAKGWGIEITEERNWLLLICGNVANLTISSTVAALVGYVLNDRQMALSLGAGLITTIFSVITTLFWYWTNT